MRKFVVFGVAAVVVGLLYIASNIFLMYDANGTVHKEIAELQASTMAEIQRLNDSIRMQRAENFELRLSVAKLTKVEDRSPFYEDPTQKKEKSSLMCVVPYGLSFFPMLPYFRRADENPIFNEVSMFGTEPFFGSTSGGSWGDLDGGKFPALLLNNYNKTTTLYTYNNTLSQQNISTFQQNISFVQQNNQLLIHNASFAGPVRASCWGDFNKDGWEDLLVVGNGVDKLYMNTNGTFVLETVPQFTADYGEGTFCQFIDINRDTHLDIVRMNSSKHLTIFRRVPKKGWEDITQNTSLPATVKVFIGLSFFEREPTLVVVNSMGSLNFFDGNRLPFANITERFKGIPRLANLVDVVIYDMNGDRMFDILLLTSHGSPIIAISEGDYAFYDFNLPTLPDLYGFADAINVQLAVADFNNDMLPDILVVRKTYYANAPNLFFQNTGEGFDVLFNGGGAAGTALGRGESVSIADFNFDGFMDMIIFNGGGEFPYNVGPTQLFLNTPNGNNWIEIEVIGTGDITNGLGVVVGIKVNETVQVQVINSRNKHRRLHFGMGNHTLVSKILVFWPMHRTAQVYYGILPNQLLTIVDFVAPIPSNRNLDVLTERGAPKIQCDPGTERLKPSFFILGIWKAGTTSLSATLYYHPQIISGAAKEYYFYTKYHETMSIDWYWSLFPCGNASNDVTFDGTAGYMFDNQVPALLHEHHPKAKFIIMLRDPIARAYSHFYMTTRSSNAEGPQRFDDLMHTHVEKYRACAEKEGDTVCAAKGAWLFLNAGLYYYAIQRWFAYFPREQFIFVLFNDLVGPNGANFVKDIQSFLGLEVYDLPTREQNISPKRAPMFESTRALLLDFYRPHNKLLYELLQTDYKWDT